MITTLVTVTLDSDQVITWVLGAAALLGALGFLGRLFWRYIGRPLRAIWKLVDQELTNNHGSSMKDDVHGIAVTVGRLSRQVDDMSSDLYNHLAEKEPKSP